MASIIKASDIHDWQLLGNGKELIVAMPGQGIFVFKNPYVTSFQIDYPHQEITCGHSGWWRELMVTGPPEATLDVRAFGVEQYDGKIDLFDFSLAKDLTVRQLFQTVRRKLNERKG